MKIIDRLMNAFGYAKASSRVYQIGTGYEGTGNLGRSTPQNYRTYLQQYADVSWVYSCIYRIATKGAGVPLKLYRKKIKGDKIVYEEIMNHPLLTLLETANSLMGGFDLLEATFSYLELTGNSYWLLDSVTGGKPTEIYPLNPFRIKIVPHPREHIKEYKYDVGQGKIITLEKEFVIQFKYFNPTDDFYGLSPISAGRLAIDTQDFGDKYNRNFFVNSAEPKGALVVTGDLTDDQRKRTIAAWNSAHRGVSNVHKMMIEEGGMKWEQRGLSQKDMDFVNSKKMTREDILGVFGVPPSLVGVFEYANYANAREQRQIFWKDTMIPKLKKLENTINSFLVTLFDPNLVVEFDLSGVESLKEDEKIRAEINEILTRSGTRTINEVREELGLERVAWGDTWNAPMNLMPITSPKPEPTSPGERGKAIPTGPELEAIAQYVADKRAKTDDPGGDEEKEREKVINDKIWQYFKLSTEAWERKFKPILRGEFTGQERETIRNLRDHGWGKLRTEILGTKKENVNQRIDVILFDEKEAGKAMRKSAKPIVKGSLADQAKKEIARLGLGIDFDVDNPEVVKWIDKKLFKFSDDVNRATKESLRKQLKTAIDEGEGIKEVEKRIENVFDIARGSRTEKIARTEMVSASNNGTMSAYKQSGVVEKKSWISSRDGDVRDSHRMDSEDPVGLDEPFSNGLMFPGDPSGGLEEVINCRCTFKGVVKV